MRTDDAPPSNGAPSDEPASALSDVGADRQMKRSLQRVLQLRSVMLPGLSVLLLLAWHWSVILFEIPRYLIPAPLDVLSAGIEFRDMVWSETVATFLEVIAGFGVAVAVGLTLALLIVNSVIFDRLIFPVLVASQAIPKVAIAPLFLVWFGFGMTPKVMISAVIAFFPIVISSVVGFRSIERDLINLARSMGPSSVKIFWKLRLPSALPSILGGLKLAATFAVIGAVVGEFVGGDAGLGYLIQVTIGLQRLDLMFVGIIVLSMMGIVLFYSIDLLEHVLLPWHESRQIDVTM